MQEVNLSKTNEVIVWKKNDEIGGLIREYNKMVAKLVESASALAKSEREGAWREMARQVAHEIKNPLTPMKLSIQYLQKANIQWCGQCERTDGQRGENPGGTNRSSFQNCFGFQPVCPYRKSAQ